MLMTFNQDVCRACQATIAPFGFPWLHPLCHDCYHAINRIILDRIYERRFIGGDLEDFISREKRIYRDLLSHAKRLLGFSEPIEQRALDIITKTKNVGFRATSVVAASLYIASYLEDEPLSQHEIANALSITETTIRKHYRRILKQMGLTPEELVRG